MSKIVTILNRRNKYGRGDVYVRSGPIRHTDEYLLLCADNTTRWLKYSSMDDATRNKVLDFEYEMRFRRRLGHMKNGLKPIRVTDMARHDNYNIMVCQFLGTEKMGPVLAEKVHEYCPEIALKFYESCLVIDGKTPYISISLGMQAKVCILYNKQVDLLSSSKNKKNSDENDDEPLINQNESPTITIEEKQANIRKMNEDLMKQKDVDVFGIEEPD